MLNEQEAGLSQEALRLLVFEPGTYLQSHFLTRVSSPTISLNN